MKCAVFDNPVTRRREAWQDGKLVAFITEKLMYTKGFYGSKRMPFMLNCGRDFISGRIIGNAEALAAQPGGRP